MKRLIALFVLLELMTGCVKIYMDYPEVDKLCATDGGIKVYEAVSLPPERFDKYGEYKYYLPNDGINQLGPDYIWKWNYTNINVPVGSEITRLVIYRDHSQIIRRVDGKLLGESINYHAHDVFIERPFTYQFFGITPVFLNNCQKNPFMGKDLVNQVFVKHESRKDKSSTGGVHP